MNFEDIWRKKNDQELEIAAKRIADYVEEAQQVIRDEIRRRGMPDPPMAETIRHPSQMSPQPQNLVEIELRPNQIWRIEDKVLVAPTGDHLDMSTLTHANYLDLPTSSYKLWDFEKCWDSSFKLKGRSAEFNLKGYSVEFHIRCVNTRTSLERRNYLSLIFAILDKLKLQNPRLKIRIGRRFDVFISTAVSIFLAILGLIVTRSGFLDSDLSLILFGGVVFILSIFSIFHHATEKKNKFLH